MLTSTHVALSDLLNSNVSRLKQIFFFFWVNEILNLLVKAREAAVVDFNFSPHGYKRRKKSARESFPVQVINTASIYIV